MRRAITGVDFLVAELKRLRPFRGADAEAFGEYKAEILANSCRERELNPLDLDNQAIAEALGYSSAESMEHVFRMKGVKAGHIAAHAYYLLRSENP